MNKEFVPYTEALALKELGFDEPCLAFWDGENTDAFYFNNIRDASGDYVPFQKHDRLKWFGAPLYQQVFRWFREKYDLDYYIYRNDDDLINYVKNKGVVDLFKYRCGYSDSTSHPIKGCYTYEEAELACLIKLIEIVKEKQ